MKKNWVLVKKLIKTKKKTYFDIPILILKVNILMNSVSMQSTNYTECKFLH